MIQLFKSLMTSFLTTSFMFGLSFRCISLDGLAFSSKYILCVQMRGLIPFRSATVHPNAFSKFESTYLLGGCQVLKKLLPKKFHCHPRRSILNQMAMALNQALVVEHMKVWERWTAVAAL